MVWASIIVEKIRNRPISYLHNPGHLPENWTCVTQTSFYLM